MPPKFLIAKKLENMGLEIFCLSNTPCATELNLITNDDLDGIPTNNLESERHLAGFGKQAAVAKIRTNASQHKG